MFQLIRFLNLLDSLKMAKNHVIMVLDVEFVVCVKILMFLLHFGWWGLCRNLSGLNLDGEISPAIGDLKSLISVYSA